MYLFFLVLGCSLAYNIEIRNLPSYNLLDIIKNKKPKIVFLENVKNFKTINDGEPYKFVISELEKYGYKFYNVIKEPT